MPEDCGAGWEWNEALGRCISADPPTAGPSLELPAGLDDYFRQAAEFVSGGAISASDWAGSRARTIAEQMWNAVLHLGQNGVTVLDLPGVGEVQLLPGHLGEGMPFSVGGFPFRVRLVPHIGDSEPNGVWNSSQVNEDQLDAVVAALYQKVGDNTIPTPLLRGVADLLFTVGNHMLNQAVVPDWPVYRLGNEVHDQVVGVFVDPYFVEELPVGYEFEGDRLLKGEVLTAWALWAVEHLQVRVPTVGEVDPQYVSIFPLLVAMITASTDRFTFYNQG